MREILKNVWLLSQAREKILAERRRFSWGYSQSNF